MAEVRAAQAGAGAELALAAIPYAIAEAPDRSRLAAELLEAENPILVNARLEALRADPPLVPQLVTHEWVERTPPRRTRAAAPWPPRHLAVRGDPSAEILYRLLQDPDPVAASAAIPRRGPAGQSRTICFCWCKRWAILASAPMPSRLWPLSVPRFAVPCPIFCWMNPFPCAFAGRFRAC